MRRIAADAVKVRRDVLGVRLIGEWSDAPFAFDGFMEEVRVRFSPGGRGTLERHKPGRSFRKNFRWRIKGTELTITSGRSSAAAAIRLLDKKSPGRRRAAMLLLDPAPWPGADRLARVRA